MVKKIIIGILFISLCNVGYSAEVEETSDNEKQKSIELTAKENIENFKNIKNLIHFIDWQKKEQGSKYIDEKVCSYVMSKYIKNVYEKTLGKYKKKPSTEQILEEIDNLKAEVIIMENDVTEAKIKYDEKVAALEYKKKAFIDGGGTEEEWAESEKEEIEKIENYYKDFCKEVDELYENYNKLADLCEIIEKTGDPVSVTTGKFIAEYTDYVAEDYLDKFSVNRNLTYENKKESFGNNWSCSLDSRIVRCNYKNQLEDIKAIKEIVNNLNIVIGKCENYINQYGNYNEEINEIYKDSKKKRQRLNC